ncbi:MAG TPA: O-antigen ligase family protein [Allosphingosinicella sp.]|nr:O-antigen ligase family protein [Allosphingosinicella sp.]
MSNEDTHGARGPLPRAAGLLLCLLAFLVGLMQPPIELLGFAAIPADLLFPAVLTIWLLALAAGQASFVWDKSYWLLLFYLAALAASMLVSTAPDRSLVKMITQLYLLALPVLVCNLVRSGRDLQRILLCWLGGTVIVVLVALAAAAVFVVDPHHKALAFARFHFGTLPPGDYPRLRATFLNANMLCNYLTVSLVVALVAGRLDWIGRKGLALLVTGIVASALLTISPGLGGIALAAGLWLWLVRSPARDRSARIALAAGIGIAILFVAAMAVTPILHPTAPFLIHVPFAGVTLAPSGRLMVWIDALNNFAANPWFGIGIGQDPVWVRYRDPSGNLQTLTDAHDSFLSIAAQCGSFGLAALVALIAYAVRLTLPFRLLPDGRNLVRLALGLAFLDGFAYQGLGGSFEDTRHLWLLFGLLLASRRIEGAPPEAMHRR